MSCSSAHAHTTRYSDLLGTESGALVRPRQTCQSCSSFDSLDTLSCFVCMEKFICKFSLFTPPTVEIIGIRVVKYLVNNGAFVVGCTMMMK